MRRAFTLLLLLPALAPLRADAALGEWLSGNLAHGLADHADGTWAWLEMLRAWMLAWGG